MLIYKRLLACLCAVILVAAEGPAFFRTNVDVYENFPIYFDKPIPKWIRGTLIRNGIGRFEVGNRRVTNALDAYAKLGSWKFMGNGSVFFSTKMVQSDSYKESVSTNDIAPYLLGAPTVPPFTLFEMAEAFENGLDNMNVNVLNFTNPETQVEDFVVVSDCWKSYLIDPFTLETKGPLQPPHPGAGVFDAPLPLSSGHPLPEPGTSNHLTFLGVNSLVPGSHPELRLIRIKSGHERELIATVDIEQLSYMHSFPVSERYAILVGVPLFIDAAKMMKHFSPLEAFKWDPNAKTQFHIIDLKTGFVKTIEGENMFYLHAINAYEPSSTELIIDLCTYKDGSALLTLNMTKLSNTSLRAEAAIPLLKRVHIDLTKNTATVTPFGLKPNLPAYINQLEYPTINENFRFKKYCYIYGISFNIDHKDFLHMAVVKKDVCNGNDKYWFTADKYYNEAWFEPRPGAIEEDDGVLLLPIFDKNTLKTNFTIFDAKDLTVISNAPLPTSNPFGTHGRFFPNVY